jgi:HK97 family phage portal protein
MGIRQSLIKWLGGEQKMSSLELFREIYGGRETSSGIKVTAESALECTVALACTRVLANGVCQIPFRVYKDEGGAKQVQVAHPVNVALYRRPNSWQTAYEFRETMMFHLVLCGNAFVFVNRVGAKREIRELILIEPGRVEVEQLPDYRLVYKVKGKEGKAKIIPQDAIWHLRAPSWNAWMGMEGVALARNSIGLSIALERSHATMHKSGAATTGLLSVKDALGPEQYQFLAKWLTAYENGGERYQKPMILDRGATFTPMQQTGIDAQHLETRKYQIEEICRAFGVMPIMVGYSDKAATYASAEQMFLAHVVHTLSPWYERLEQSADVNLLTPQEVEAGYYTKFTPNALMRGAAADRAEFYAKGLGAGNGKGWLTQNDVRALEEMDRVDDPEADKLPQPPVAAPVAEPSAVEPAKSAGMTGAELKEAFQAMPAPVVNVDVHSPDVKAGDIKIDVHAHMPKRGPIEKTVTAYDEQGRIVGMTERETDDA